MKKRWIAIAVILIVIAGTTVGLILSHAETSVPIPTVTSAPPSTPKQTPTTMPKPTPTPTQTPTPTRVPFTGRPDQKAISIQEFIADARAGKYKLGEWITVSAVYESYYRDPKITMYFFFGPQADGDYLIIDGDLTDAGTIPFAKLSKGDKVTVMGLYNGFTTIDGKTGGVLEHSDIRK